MGRMAKWRKDEKMISTKKIEKKWQNNLAISIILRIFATDIEQSAHPLK